MRSLLSHTKPEVPVAEKADTKPTDAEAGKDDATSHSDSEDISKDAQTGVQDMQAMTTVWSTYHLIAAYILIWVIAFLDSLQSGMSFALTPFVTSNFQRHSLTAATDIMASLIGGLFKLPLAKILDIWGRPQGFGLMVIMMTMGLIMMAGCNNVQTFAAAQVFYWVGYNGVSYTISIFIADTSALKNRALMFAFSSSPYIVTTWASGPMAESFLKHTGFRWGFGTFAIVVPVVCSLLFGLFMYNYNKAKKVGLLPKRESNRTTMESLKYYFFEFDIIGLLLITSGLAMFLLPFSLYSYQADGWKSPLVLCLIIFGGLLVIAFALYEKLFAPVTFIPFDLLTDRTVLGACILAGVLFVSFYIWNSFFFSFLLVVNNLSVTHASYIRNIYSIGSCLWAIVVGILIRWSGRFKWLAVWFGVPFTILGVGLMIRFRQPDVNVGYIVMCQIFIAFAGGTLVICEQMAVMAATSHQFVAVVLAIEGMFSHIGGAVGSTIATAVWTGVFPKKLAEYLPPESQGNLTAIYGDVAIQSSYPVGSPTRNAINRAYGDAQKYMLIAATAILSLAVVSTAVWRDIKVKDFKQVKGRVV
ncbi:siderophore iron transporter [Coccidioides immitis RS]|uniref:Siderophore iron transporter n=3 Tax=Coccidioides immitis TaxID=5501 RepID=A0A0E1S0B8_COCIM|nr:siderophore iron transporter [Coccidioides immitis RS]EAS36082.1 siderophore iron transporter [Coccidioides immitis RS]KMP01394.1 siderophore iron transporter [Coccidioides immitis RMSCC 2394]KMU92602.1 siderophore iron transporter [Coccidioides immitis H538.4]